MIKKRFTIEVDEENITHILDNNTDIGQYNLCTLLNELNDENNRLKSICQDHRDHAIDFKADCVRLEKENEELKKENEKWKSSACNNSSFNSILLHELDIAQEQGYKLSDPFKKLMREKND